MTWRDAGVVAEHLVDRDLTPVARRQPAAHRELPCARFEGVVVLPVPRVRLVEQARERHRADLVGVLEAVEHASRPSSKRNDFGNDDDVGVETAHDL